MRKHYFSVLLTIIFIFVISCNNDTDLDDGYIDPKITNVVIKIPQNNYRIATDLARQSNIFEAFLINSLNQSEIYSASANVTNGEIRLLVPAGNFNLLLLAGVSAGSGIAGPVNIIYGSCTKYDISISYDSVTTLSLPMKAFSLVVSTNDDTEIEIYKTVTINVDTNIDAKFAFFQLYVDLENSNTHRTNPISITPTREFYNIAAKVTQITNVSFTINDINRLFIGGLNGRRTNWIVRDDYNIPVKTAVLDGTITWE